MPIGISQMEMFINGSSLPGTIGVCYESPISFLVVDYGNDIVLYRVYTRKPYYEAYASIPEILEIFQMFHLECIHHDYNVNSEHDLLAMFDRMLGQAQGKRMVIPEPKIDDIRKLQEQQEALNNMLRTFDSHY